MQLNVENKTFSEKNIEQIQRDRERERDRQTDRERETTHEKEMNIK